MTITDTNIFVLDELFSSDGGVILARVPNSIRPSDVRHAKRCLAAGMFTVEADVLVLTESGRSAIESYRVRNARVR